ncbi:MAG: Gfo/Idh/MocA family protein [Armatimonadota bacterium]
MKPVKFGVIGCGVIGPTHMAAAADFDYLDLVAVADLIPERAQAAAEKYNVPKVYTQGTDLIDDPEVELVVLAMPACHRKDLALRAFAKGKHVLTEKPVAMNAGEVDELIAARGNLKAACCCSRYTFITHHQVAADFIAAGNLGALRNVYIRSYFPNPLPPTEPKPEWRLKRHLNGGGFAMNWGCYDLDYLLSLTGWALKPEKCFGQHWQIAPHLLSHLPEGSDAETYYTALVRCEGGTMLSMDRGEYMSIANESAWHIIGEKGSLRLTMTAVSAAGPSASAGASNWKQILFDEATTDRGLVSTVLWEGEEDLSRVMNGPVSDLALAIREDRDPRTTLEKARLIQQITDAVYQSGWTGDCVTF